ncbi:MAG TPA: ABC transporter permease [Thermoflexales bacterium]|nr:ABC transporter permease [Thermoflexales bacterium]HQW34209.1 ABC transporter permease [Thermoflexales bacterium]HQZ20861.1 ABC transporter permease [Thermoflexales bacterium]HQZ98668.1 ABC transporter permease [Thermoflexales bacterium]
MLLSNRLNPLLRTELRRRFRNARSFGALTVYLAVVSGLALALYLGVAISNANGPTGGGIESGRAAGTSLFYITSGLLLVLVCFIGPLFSVGAIAAERENATLDALRMTPLPAREIVLAKFASAYGYVVLLTLVTLPIFALVLIIGGVEAAEIAVVLCVILCAGFAFTALGVLASAISKTRMTAAILTYTVVLLLVMGTAIFSLIAAPGLMALRTALASSGSALGVFFGQLLLILPLSFSPISAIVSAETNFRASGHMLSITPDPLPGLPATSAIAMPAPFALMTLFYLLAGIVLLIIAIRKVKTMDDRR